MELERLLSIMKAKGYNSFSRCIRESLRLGENVPSSGGRAPYRGHVVPDVERLRLEVHRVVTSFDRYVATLDRGFERLSRAKGGVDAYESATYALVEESLAKAMEYIEGIASMFTDIRKTAVSGVALNGRDGRTGDSVGHRMGEKGRKKGKGSAISGGSADGGDANFNGEESSTVKSDMSGESVIAGSCDGSPSDLEMDAIAGDDPGDVLDAYADDTGGDDAEMDMYSDNASKADEPERAESVEVLDDGYAYGDGTEDMADLSDMNETTDMAKPDASNEMSDIDGAGASDDETVEPASVDRIDGEEGDATSLDPGSDEDDECEYWC